MEMVKVENSEGVYCITSLEIVKKTGKDHKNILRDIRAMLEGLGLDKLKFESIYLDSRNRDKPMYLLPEREAMILAAQYDVKVTAVVVDYFLGNHRRLPELTLAEQMLVQAQYNVDQERKIKRVEEVQEILTESVDDVEEAQEVLTGVVSDMKGAMENRLGDMEENIKQQNRGIKNIRPKPGYRGVTYIDDHSRLSRSVIEFIVSKYPIDKCNCSKYQEDAGFMDYLAYDYKRYLQYEVKFIKEAIQVTSTLHEHPKYTGRFKIKEIK